MNPAFQPLIDEVAKLKSVSESAVKLIGGINERINKAVADALAGGATAQELADAVTKITAEAEAAIAPLADAVAANTPAAPTV